MFDVFYQPPNAFMGDIIPYYDRERGLFQIFYLKKHREANGEIVREGWHMLTTTDQVHFAEHCCHILGATGSVLFADGVYHLFFTRFERQYNPVRQWIHHAVSYDGMETWVERPGERFEADGVLYEKSDMRDPFVFWNEEEKCYWMLVSTQDRKAPTKRKGCVGLLKSEDLSQWRFCDPLYSPGTNPSALECSDLFRMGDWYYLIYSCYTDRFQTVYRMSRSLQGPWITPEVDTFDARAFYAAKTGSDGQHRYLYGWNATRRDDLWGFDPREDFGDDYRTWDWGGSMVIHELTQQQDGTLTVSPLKVLKEYFPAEQALSIRPLSGEWQIHSAGAASKSPYRYSAALLNEVPRNCRLTAEIAFETPIRQFGIALQVDEEFDLGYYLILEPHRNRVQFQSGLRLTEDGGKMFPYEIEMERPLALSGTGKVRVELYVQDTMLVAYFNGQVALSTRMFNRRGARFGLFVSEGTADFRELHLYGQEEGANGTAI